MVSIRGNIRVSIRGNIWVSIRGNIMVINGIFRFIYFLFRCGIIYLASSDFSELSQFIMSYQITLNKYTH